MSHPNRHTSPAALGLILALVVLVALSAPASALAANPTFSTAHYRTEAGPYHVAVADFNADGKPDLAVDNWGAATVSVYLGNGAGSFSTEITSGISGAPNAFAVGDLNHDHKADLASTPFSGQGVAVRLGDGSGRFLPPSSYWAGFGSTVAAITDVDADADPDLLIGNSSNLFVLKGDGSGGLSNVATIPGGGWGLNMVVRDVNADGRPDVVMPNTVSNTLQAFLATTSIAGYFESPKSSSPGSAPRGVALADFNRDGKQDAVVTLPGGLANVMLGNGTGAFGSVGTLSLGPGGDPNEVATGDLNGDGKTDFAIADAAGSGVSDVAVFLGNGAGGFSGKKAYPAGPSAQAIAIADVNRDTRPDILVTSNSPNTVSVLRNTLRFPCSLTRPALSPASPTHGRTFVVSGQLRPRNIGAVKLYFFRKRSGVWKRYSIVGAHLKNFSSYTKYYLSYHVPTAGPWYVKAYHTDPAHKPTFSTKRNFTAR